MGVPQEPAYQRFEGVCRECGKAVHYHNSIQRHPDHVICEDCERGKITETLTGMKTIGGAVKGWG